MISKQEWDICSDYLIENLSFDKLYDNCAPISKEKFHKEHIISSIKRLIKEYPDNFDKSVKDRIEALTSTLSISRGYLNGYMYIINSGYHFGWFLTVDKLFETIELQKNNNVHHFIFDTKEYLRNLKIKKICQTLIKHTK